MDSRYSVSVVIPHFNAIEHLERALTSVESQTVQVAEIIVVDDASTTVSESELQTLIDCFDTPIRSCRLIRLSENKGPGHARNVGWNIARQDFIAFLDSDDEWHTQKIEIQIREMLRTPGLGMTSHTFANSDLPIIDNDIDARHVKLSLAEWIIRNRASTPTVVVKREISHRFPDDARYSEDYELWLRIAANGIATGYIPLQLARANKSLYGDSGLGSNLWRMEFGELRAIRRSLSQSFQYWPLIPIVSSWSLLKFFRRLVLAVAASFGIDSWKSKLSV